MSDPTFTKDESQLDDLNFNMKARMPSEEELSKEAFPGTGITVSDMIAYQKARLKLVKEGKPYVPPHCRPPHPVQMVFESCFTKAAISGVMGAGMGFLFGMLFSSQGMSDPEFGKKATRVQIKETFRNVGRNGMSYAKGFGSAGLLFAGSQCLIEKVTARASIWNNVLAGCAAGIGLSYKGGPQAMAMGCVGFAGFSLVIDTILEEKDPREDIEFVVPDEAFLAAEQDAFEAERERDMAELAKLRSERAQSRKIIPTDDEDLDESNEYSSASSFVNSKDEDLDKVVSAYDHSDSEEANNETAFFRHSRRAPKGLSAYSSSE